MQWERRSKIVKIKKNGQIAFLVLVRNQTACMGGCAWNTFPMKELPKRTARSGNYKRQKRDMDVLKLAIFIKQKILNG